MRLASQDFSESLVGNRFNECVKISVFAGSELKASSIMLDSWDFSETLDQQVKGSFNATIIDDSGDLIPYRYGDILSPGHRVVVDYCLNNTQLRFGEYVITAARPAYNVYIRSRRVAAKSGKIKVECKDLTALLAADRLLAPESPKRNATVYSELVRLAKNIPVTITAGLEATRSVPASVVYERERMNAIDDLAERITGFVRQTQTGGLEVVPINPSLVPVWEIVGGETGTLIEYSSDLALDDIYNGVISSSGAGQDGQQVYVGRAFETDGPLRWGGIIGCRPYFHSSSLISSQDQASKDAKTRLESLIRNRFVKLNVTCLANPLLQVGDVVGLPSLAGAKKIDTADIKGIVTSVKFSGGLSGVSAATLEVKVVAKDFFEAVGG